MGANITASTTGSSGRAGDITVNADSIEMTGISADRSSISGISSQSEPNLATRVAATGDAGNVNVTTRTLRLRDGAGISTNTSGSGRGGDLNVTATDSIELSGTATLTNGLFASQLLTGTIGSGRAGNLQVTTGNLQLRGGAAIIASTASTGRAGNIQVTADSILLNGTSRNQPRRQQLSSGIASETASKAEGAGNAGNIRVSTTRLNIRDRAAISTITIGQGNAGNITVQNRGDTILNAGNIGSSVGAGAVGNGGRITLMTRSLSVDGGQIAAAVGGQNRDLQNNLLPGGRGRGGDIFVTATNGITLTGTNRDGFSGGILTLSERGANGSAGNITIRASDFRIANGAIVVASTFNRGEGGDIEINADNFEAVNGGQVVTNTRSRGDAGTITLNIQDNAILSGFDSNFQNRRERAGQYVKRPNTIDLVSDVIANQGSSSGLFANTGSQSSGAGGAINLNADNLSLTDRATISARSQGEGIAGNIRLNLNDRLSATNSDIVTSAQTSGGSIDISSNAIRLRGDSDIRTEVANDAGNGGDVTLAANSIVAFDDSDILAFAGERGGDINFNSPAVFFEGGGQVAAASASDTTNLDNNNRVDVNADGAVAGVINLPDTSQIQNSLADLPNTAIDTESLLANSCIARPNNGGIFLITGTGGLRPDRPGTNPLSPYPTDTVRSTPDGGWQPGDPIVEPQGVYRLPNGQLVLMHDCQQDVARENPL